MRLRYHRKLTHFPVKRAERGVLQDGIYQSKAFIINIIQYQDDNTQLSLIWEWWQIHGSFPGIRVPHSGTRRLSGTHFSSKRSANSHFGRKTSRWASWERRLIGWVGISAADGLAAVDLLGCRRLCAEVSRLRLRRPSVESFHPQSNGDRTGVIVVH